jgi:hypothetical protein
MHIKIRNGTARPSGMGIKKALHMPDTIPNKDNTNLKNLRNTLKTLILDKTSEMKDMPVKGTGIAPNRYKKKKYIEF